MKFTPLIFRRKKFASDSDAHVQNLRLLEDWAKRVQSDLRFIRWGEGDPNGNVVAPVGALYLKLDGGTGDTLWVKETGTGDTGWVAK